MLDQKYEMTASQMEDTDEPVGQVQPDSSSCCSNSAKKLKSDFDDCSQNVRSGCNALKSDVMSINYKEHVKRFFSFNHLKERLPIIGWLPNYRCAEFQGDLIAGLTVGLTVIPQGLAYAQVAELPPVYGLYSAFIGCFVYCILGTSKDITLGPTAIMSIMTATFAKPIIPNNASVAIVASLMCGIVQLAMGILSLGFLVDFISAPVINSFTCAAAITIAAGQLKKWLGIKSVHGEGFIQEIYQTFKYIKETRLWDCILGVICMIILYIFKKLKNAKWNTAGASNGKLIAIKIIWFMATARNAIVVILTSVVAYGIKDIRINYNDTVFSLTGEIESQGLPPFQFPNFTVEGTPITGPSEMLSEIGIGLAVIPILSVVEAMAIGKSFARKNGYRIIPNQELIAIGSANIMGSFVGAYPVTGSFSRTAVNSQSGVKTPAGGVWTGLLVILTLLFLTPVLQYIPDSALAAVIIMAVLDMVSFQMLRRLWVVKKADIFPWIVCFVFSFALGIEFGIIIGVFVSIAMLLYPWSRPSIRVNDEEHVSIQRNKDVVVLQLDQGLCFPGIEHVKQRILNEAIIDEEAHSIVLDCSHLANLDYSCVQGLQALLEDFERHGVVLVLCNLQPSMLLILQKAKLSHLRHCETVEEACQLVQGEATHNPGQHLLAEGAATSQNYYTTEDVHIPGQVSNPSNSMAHL